MPAGHTRSASEVGRRESKDESDTRAIARRANLADADPGYKAASSRKPLKAENKSTASNPERASPCAACPWMQKGQPDITPEVREAAEAGAWFCCHVHLGTCHGAALVSAHHSSDDPRSTP